MKKRINLITIGFLILGILFGIVLPEFMKNISFLGEIYINLLKFIVVPILITNMIVVFYKSKKNSTKLISKTIILF